jgi:hypothetical protein
MCNTYFMNITYPGLYIIHEGHIAILVSLKDLIIEPSFSSPAARIPE